MLQMKKFFLLLTFWVIMLGNILGQNIEVEHLFVKNDCSNQSKIFIPYQPSSVVVNITGIESMPTQKNVNLHAWIEVWDKEGISFRYSETYHHRTFGSVDRTSYADPK